MLRLRRGGERQSLHCRDSPSPNSSYRGWMLLLSGPLDNPVSFRAPPTGPASAGFPLPSWTVLGLPFLPNASYAPHVSFCSSCSPCSQRQPGCSVLKRLIAVTPELQVQYLITSCTTLSRLLSLLTPQLPWLYNGDKIRLHLGQVKALSWLPNLQPARRGWVLTTSANSQPQTRLFLEASEKGPGLPKLCLHSWRFGPQSASDHTTWRRQPPKDHVGPQDSAEVRDSAQDRFQGTEHKKAGQSPCPMDLIDCNTPDLSGPMGGWLTLATRPRGGHTHTAQPQNPPPA